MHFPFLSQHLFKILYHISSSTYRCNQDIHKMHLPTTFSKEGQPFPTNTKNSPAARSRRKAHKSPYLWCSPDRNDLLHTALDYPISNRTAPYSNQASSPFQLRLPARQNHQAKVIFSSSQYYIPISHLFQPKVPRFSFLKNIFIFQKIRFLTSNLYSFIMRLNSTASNALCLYR